MRIFYEVIACISHLDTIYVIFFESPTLLLLFKNNTWKFKDKCYK
jgi:hypothetical protein